MFRISTRKHQMKRLTNNRKGVSQRGLGRKFNVSHMTICRQLPKYIVLNVKKRINIQKNRHRKQRICAKNLATYYTDRNAA
jgi:hypothetical protein